MKTSFHLLCLMGIASLLLAISSAAIVADAGDAESTAEQSGRSAEQIAKWVADLDSNQYRVREAATQQLAAASVAAIEPLVSAANSKNPEPADRAVWILRQLGQSPDRDVALAALSGLASLRDRPAIVEQAEAALDRLREQICQEELAKLGGRLTIVVDQMEFTQVQMLRVVLDDNWHGTTDDLKGLKGLKHRNFFRLEGAAVGDAEARLFADLDHLQVLKLINTRVTPAAVDAIKAQNPAATVYMKNRALFGISGTSHTQGVIQGVVVQSVQPGTAAATAGVAPGDVITQIEGQPLPDFDRLTARIAQHAPGDEIDVQILRGDDRMTKRVKLGTWASVEAP
jgi:hypothetical protein